MEVTCTICNNHSNTMEKHERHLRTADHQIRAKIYEEGMAAGEYKAQSELAALRTQNAELLAALERADGTIIIALRAENAKLREALKNSRIALTFYRLHMAKESDNELCYPFGIEAEEAARALESSNE